ncbi:MAG: hypothetical protein M0033_10675 [Nitrospiraceae bacterium]|nr:hypothetical protein [Nitrospiraceae bacterium]
MKLLHLAIITSACLFLMFMGVHAADQKTPASPQNKSTGQSQNKKWEYYKEDWFRYVDGLLDAIPITDMTDDPKLSPNDPALAELKKDLNFSDVSISSMAAIVESEAQIRRLGKERETIATRMAGFEDDDKDTREYRRKMGPRADELYGNWKKGIKEYNQKIEKKLRDIKKDVEAFKGQLSNDQRNRFLDWKKKKAEENQIKEREEWKKQKQILENFKKRKKNASN